jgi:hypothetical protein
MTYVPYNEQCEPRARGEGPSKPGNTETEGGIIRRLFGWIASWDRSRADREVGRLLARTGERFTDDLERRMMERASNAAWGAFR